jgi:hypothetical protein
MIYDLQTVKQKGTRAPVLLRYAHISWLVVLLNKCARIWEVLKLAEILNSCKIETKKNKGDGTIIN